MRASAHALAQTRARVRLAALAGVRRPRRGPLPKQLQPNAIRFAYAQALLGVLEHLKAEVWREVVPLLPEFARTAGVVHDAESPAGYADSFIRLVQAVARRFFGQFTNERLRTLAAQFGERTSEFNRVQLAKQFRAAIGIDILQVEPRLAPRLEAWATENAALIRRVPQQFLDEVQVRTLAAFRQGERAEDVQKIYEERFGVSESRARLIARDQVGKLNAQVNQARQQAMGVTRFRWGASEDERECPECMAHDGKIYSWDDPPADGAPGDIHPNCRCLAEPVLADVLEGL